MWYVIQCGYRDPRGYTTAAEAQAEADRLNDDADEDCGQEVLGDGAASIVEGGELSGTEEE